MCAACFFFHLGPIVPLLFRSLAGLANWRQRVLALVQHVQHVQVRLLHCICCATSAAMLRGTRVGGWGREIGHEMYATQKNACRLPYAARDSKSCYAGHTEPVRQFVDDHLCQYAMNRMAKWLPAMLLDLWNSDLWRVSRSLSSSRSRRKRVAHQWMISPPRPRTQVSGSHEDLAWSTPTIVTRCLISPTPKWRNVRVL